MNEGTFTIRKKIVAGKPYYELLQNGVVVFNSGYIRAIVAWIERHLPAPTDNGAPGGQRQNQTVAA